MLQRRRRGGNVAIILALSLVLLLGVAAIAIDTGYARVVREELQNVSEASARAGAAQLDGTSAGVTAARTIAASVAAQNRAAGHAVALNTSDITFGNYDGTTGAFVTSTNAADIDAIEVRARLPNVRTFFAAAAMNRSSIPVSAVTRVTAQHGGAGSVACYIPLALPACQIDRHGVSGLQDLTLQINPPSIDSVGWGRANGSPNSNWTRDQINNCESGGAATVGDPVGLQNGVVSSAMTALITRVSGSSTRWSTTKWGALPTKLGNSSISAADYGKTYEGPVLIFDGGSAYCTGSGGQFNQSKPLVGFIWGAIYDVANGGSASSRTIKMRLDVSQDYNFGEGTGGPDYGVVSNQPPRMIAAN